MPDRIDPEVLERVRGLVSGLGTHKEAAEKTGIAYATLQRVLAGKSPLTLDRLTRIAGAAGANVEDILAEVQIGLGEVPSRSAAPSVMSIPALNIKAAAGDGSLTVGARLAPGPFHFAEDWLRRSFGSVAGLRLVQVRGASQEPELHDGDWVLIDEARHSLENGLAVLLLDDCLMIKWVQREGHTLRLISKNPQYTPTELDLRRDEDRIRVIGRAVFLLKGLA